MKNTILILFILSPIMLNAQKYRTTYICIDNKTLYIDEILGKYVLTNQKDLAPNVLPAISSGKIKRISRDTTFCIDSICNDTIILVRNSRMNKLGDLKVSNSNKYLKTDTRIYTLEELDSSNRVLYYAFWKNGKCILERSFNTVGTGVRTSNGYYNRTNEEMRFVHQSKRQKWQITL